MVLETSWHLDSIVATLFLSRLQPGCGARYKKKMSRTPVQVYDFLTKIDGRLAAESPLASCPAVSPSNPLRFLSQALPSWLARCEIRTVRA